MTDSTQFTLSFEAPRVFWDTQAGPVVDEMFETVSVSAAEDASYYAVTLYFMAEAAVAPAQEMLEELARQAGEELLAITVGETPEIDWLSHVYEQFPPLALGRFWVYGAHAADQPMPEGLHPIQIEAATAFGTGKHGTTAGCLMALSTLAEEGSTPARVLDMGCGSGILAIAAQKLWPDAQVLGADNDPDSVEMTAENARDNQTPSVKAVLSDGFKDPVVGDNAPYDLICANILAQPLVDMAPDLVASLALGKGARVVLSGLLQEQEAMVASAYRAEGLRVLTQYPQEEWQTLVLGR